MYLYLERDQHRAPHTRCLAPPSGRGYTPLLKSLLEGRGVCRGRAGVQVWEGEKEIFIFKPLCLFCLKLKKGKMKCVSFA